MAVGSVEMPYFETIGFSRNTKMSRIETMMKGKGLWLLVLLCTCASGIWAQAGIEVDGTVTDKNSNRKLGGVTVEVLRGGAEYDAVRTNGSGKYTLALDHGADYVLVFTLDDMSERKVEVNTSTIPEEFRSEVFFLNVNMSMFEVPPGMSQALLDKPIGIVAFNASKEKLDWDMDYTRDLQGQINAALEGASDAADSGETTSAADNKDYREHMRKAEVEFGRERWAQSINWLERALQEVPGDARAESLIEEATENLARAEEEAAQAAEFSRLMREGQIKMKRKDWSGALTALESAAEINPDDPDLIELLAEISAETGGGETDEEAVVDNAAQSEADAAAEEAAERASRQKEYDRLISKADKSFDRQNYADAKKMYEQAALVLPDETYPYDRIAEANDLIVDLTRREEVDEEAGAPSELEGNDREYEDRVREGDQAFDAQQWEESKMAYEAALELKPEERYPKNRLRRLEKLMEGETMDAELEVDTEAMMEADAEAAEAAAAESDALAAEQAQLLEAERDAAAEEESRRRAEAQAASDAGRDRSRNYLLALQRNDEDDAEAYYRNALESEIRARAQSVELVAERNSEQTRLWTGHHHARRGSQWMDIQERTADQAELQYDASLSRNDRVSRLDLRVEAQSEAEKDVVERANALRRDRYVTIEQDTRVQQRALYERTERYVTFVDSLDRILEAYSDFNRDIRRASVDARIMRYEEVQREARGQQKVGQGSEARRLDNLLDVREVERTDGQARRASAGEAQLRSASALREVHDKYSGAPLTSEDYKDVKAKEGIRSGVEERSYEEGNALIIERTVRVDNEVNIYRKTVAKHGVYYFKNNQSITKDIWILETFEISD